MTFVKAYSCEGEGAPTINVEHVAAVEPYGSGNKQRIYLSGGFFITVLGSHGDVIRRLRNGQSVGERQTGRHFLGAPE